MDFSQCRTVKIAILGDEGVPVQVDGEAWIQPPGYIWIVHKNRAQTLTRDRVGATFLHYEPSQQKITPIVWYNIMIVFCRNRQAWLCACTQDMQCTTSFKWSQKALNNVICSFRHLRTPWSPGRTNKNVSFPDLHLSRCIQRRYLKKSPLRSISFAKQQELWFTGGGSSSLFSGFKQSKGHHSKITI